MNGIFSDILEACANWFLYIFIDGNAPLNSTIMKKRANQITWLKRLDSINPTYTYNDLVNIVHQGIVKKYGQTPAQVLTTIYNTATGTVNGIGASVLETETAKANENLKNLALQTTDTTTGETKKENFWSGVDKVLSYLQQILSLLGAGKTKDIQPVPADWYQPTKAGFLSSASIIPWIAAAGIIFFALSGSDNNNNNKGKKKN